MGLDVDDGKNVVRVNGDVALAVDVHHMLAFEVHSIHVPHIRSPLAGDNAASDAWIANQRPRTAGEQTEAPTPDPDTGIKFRVGGLWAEHKCIRKWHSVYLWLTRNNLRSRHVGIPRNHRRCHSTLHRISRLSGWEEDFPVPAVAQIYGRCWTYDAYLPPPSPPLRVSVSHLLPSSSRLIWTPPVPVRPPYSFALQQRLRPYSVDKERVYGISKASSSRPWKH